MGVPYDVAYRVQEYFSRQLCILLGSGSIYRCLSVLLLKDNDKEFVSQMVALLNGILLTSSELFELRKQLRTLESEASFFLHLKLCSICFFLWVHILVSLKIPVIKNGSNGNFSGHLLHDHNYLPFKSVYILLRRAIIRSFKGLCKSLRIFVSYVGLPTYRITWFVCIVAKLRTCKRTGAALVEGRCYS